MPKKWDVEAVEEFLTRKGFKTYAQAFRNCEITGAQLTDCLDEDTLSELIGIKSKLGRSKVMEAISQLISKDQHTGAAKSDQQSGVPASKRLPDGKTHHFFGCFGVLLAQLDLLHFSKVTQERSFTLRGDL